jgi:hypothetical protein
MRILGRSGWALLLAGCSSFAVVGPDGDTARLDEPFTLAPGQSIRIRGTLLDVRFVGVTDDSRCPSDVVCVWEGDAAVGVETELVGVPESHTLHTTGGPGGGPRAVERDGYRIELEELRPYPVSDQAIAPAEYRATLVVTRTD